MTEEDNDVITVDRDPGSGRHVRRRHDAAHQHRDPRAGRLVPGRHVRVRPRREGDLRGVPGLAVRHRRRSHLPVLCRQAERHDRSVGGGRNQARARPRDPRPVGVVRRRGHADRTRHLHPGGRRAAGADRDELRLHLPHQPADDRHDGHLRRPRRGVLPDGGVRCARVRHRGQVRSDDLPRRVVLREPGLQPAARRRYLRVAAPPR